MTVQAREHLSVVILGHELRHGFGQKHYRKMMFRRGTARYQVRSEHEDLDTSGGRLRTSAGYLHQALQSVSQYLTKTNFWTDQDVVRDRLPSKAPSVGWVAWTPRGPSTSIT